jgi:cell division protein FtsB
VSPKLALNLALLTLLLLLQWPLWLGKGSLWEVHKLEKQLRAQEADIAARKERNTRIASDVKDLEAGLGAAETQARRDLGMIKSDEVFIQVTPGNAAASKPASGGNQGASKP